MLCPPELKQARAAYRDGHVSLEQLSQQEDAAVLAAALQMQREVGLEVFTDGEYRRASWLASLRESVGLHFCRGNARSSWVGTGGYEPVAERLFGEVEADRFLLEYDTERAGGFEPLRFVPPGKTVVLGLVSTKTPVLESPDELLRRIDQAAGHIPMDQLALGPQCGFASSVCGNPLTPDDQRRKLELVVDTAQMAWG